LLLVVALVAATTLEDLMVAREVAEELTPTTQVVLQH
jgi:hypothetical protein